eukprot:TRINITY_DN22326_c0_g1_i1.p1 TRINITY_DN22326_c0_g1~~TRINITY_DN22326_c0_g1_i1.p1  ORF type:complete len:317 (+),score=43.20 TRINITY_DN22326_c0_g1_i1:103-1053(+)
MTAEDEAHVSIFGDHTEEDFYAANRVKTSSAFITNARGMKLFTQEWLPVEGEPKALIFACHGYGNNISWNLLLLATKFANRGFGFYSIDYEGHGKSEGLRCYLPKLDDVADDCIQYFDSVKARPESQGKKQFLYGESLGGAVCILITHKQPQAWSGAILLAPMCKIGEKMKPPAIVVTGLSWLAAVIPWAPIVPTREVINASFHDPVKLERAKANPLRYLGQPRLGTAIEMLRVTDFIAAHLEEVLLPFLLLHGTADIVTDPEVSKALYEQSRSTDKTLKLYQGMCHALLAGETDDNVEIIFKDVLDWLNARLDKP